MKPGEAKIRSLARLSLAFSRTRRPPPLPPRRPDPGGESDGLPVDAPRTPTLSGGAAARPDEDAMPA